MMDNTKIEVGYALPKERWLEAADNLLTVGTYVAEILKVSNCEGRGEQHAMDWLANVSLACTALCYVAEFAADKCRMIPLSKGMEETE